jgi:hypothetical protein
MVSAGSVNANELANCHCSSSAAATGYAPTYVQMPPTLDPSNALNSFDDLVTYRERWQMQASWDKTGGCPYVYARTITIDHTKVATVGNTDQTNFPVLVSGTYSYLATQANGGKIQNTVSLNGQTVPADLAFTSDSACIVNLNWEIASYTASTGQIEAWVQVPTLSHSSDTVIYMCYDRTAVKTYQSTVASTWDSNFKGVWHLSNGISLSALDSTSNANNGTINGPNATAGKIGGAGSFANNSIAVPMSGFPTGSGVATTEGWAYLSVIPSSLDFLFSYGTGSYANASGIFFMNDGSGNLQVVYSSWGPGIGSNARPSLNNWHHIVGTYDGTNMCLYIDGALDDCAAQAQNTINTVAFIGAWVCGGSCVPMTGFIDEVRLSSVVRSADWIVTEYNNQHIPDKASGAGGFYTVGAAAAPH